MNYRNVTQMCDRQLIQVMNFGISSTMCLLVAFTLILPTINLTKTFVHLNIIYRHHEQVASIDQI
jgi:uncharacterized Tic20 family protein